jgi:hypothetical protein
MARVAEGCCRNPGFEAIPVRVTVGRLAALTVKVY